MSDRLRLVIFDVDGTLVDSQADILGAMTASFTAQGLEVPAREAVLSIVGLSLTEAMTRLVPHLPVGLRDELVAGYKHAYMSARLTSDTRQTSPLYPGARAVLDLLAAQPYTLLGVATGKSQRGLDALIASHGLEGLFLTRQVADHHPSKPHPSMLLAALRETGVDPADAVMVGDTSYDMEMARAAGICGIGVSWGYHAPAALKAASCVIDRFDELPACLEEIWRIAA
ncbi:MAG: HAD-IA family hydrolase [Rhodobacterales bacterium]|nr:HAD-IA family hydrolase [Rhodobacterales bacterium]MDX5413338.1 HAD-IA family hydrolase [Rhodobacterales bacterium]